MIKYLLTIITHKRWNETTNLCFVETRNHLGCVPELKIPPHPSSPLHVFPNWKDYYQAKKTLFSLPSPPPVKWISGTQH
ncbi:hypothetical protein Hanom_Chr09g00768471 [Helianthus anomalus]